MEEFLDAVTGGAIWGIGFGVALTAVQAAGSGMRPVARGAVKGVVSVGDWLRDVSAEARENLEDAVQEARAEMQRESAGETSEATTTSRSA